MYDAGHPKSVLCDNMGRGGGRDVGGGFRMEGMRVYLCLIHVDIWQKPSRFYKVIALQVK